MNRSNSRDRGFVEGLKAYPDIKLVGNRVGNNEEAEGMSLTADMLTKDPDLVGLFADNAQMGPARALRSPSRSWARNSAWSPSTPMPESWSI